jgi:hypothetical protein
MTYYGQPQSSPRFFVALMKCGVCGDGIVGRFDVRNFEQWWHQGIGTSSPSEIWPKRDSGKSPEHVAANISAVYLQGLDNLARKNFDAAGAMFRKT